MRPLVDQPVQQATVIDSYPLTSMQAGMLYGALRQPQGQGVDVQQVAMTILTPLDPGLFVYAWYQVMERHAVLRTRLRWEALETGPVQEVLDAVELPVTRVDWRGLEADVLRARLLKQATAERREGFNLAKAPLMRLFMARVGDSAWSVLWTFHHVILDGRSFPLVLREVFEIHDALRGRQEPALCLPMPFKRYVDRGANLDLAAAEAYWRRTLNGVTLAAPVGLELPPALAAQSPHGQPYGARQLALSVELSQALNERARAASLSPTTLLYAAWALMLHRCSGRNDLVFGTTRSTRHTLDGDPLAWVGPFITTVPMRITVDRGQTVDDWLSEIRAQQLAMRPHEQLPLHRIQACAGAGPDNPLFESLVVYDRLSLQAQMRRLGPTWTHRHFDYVGQTGYPLALIAYGDECMPLRLEYDRRRFSDATAERLLGHVQTVLQSLAADEHVHVGQLPWLTHEQYQALIGPNPQTFPTPLPLHRVFERQAHHAPLAPAITLIGAEGQREEISYGRLNAQANRLARQLLTHGTGSGQIVGLRAERNLDVALGILAILKAGCAYLPLDPVYPAERAAFMLEDAGVRVALVSASLAAGWQPPGISCIVMEQGQAQGEAEALLAWDEVESDLPDFAKPTDLAYVIYTSGSTGRPKGVPITHHNVARLFAASQSDFGFDERDVWTLFHSYSFDFSVWELWGALLHGGRLVVISQDISRNAEAFFDLVVRERVTVLNQTPTAFRRIVDVARQGPAASLSLRYVIFGGEALELQMLKPWFERYGDTRPELVNMYGITETTVHVTRRVLREADLRQGSGSVIGEALPDLRLLLLDDKGEPVPLGAAGELVVGGDGLSPGYLNRPELTGQRFVPDHVSGEPGRRLYRSGDLARWLDNGELEYLGRIDQQVKIRGFRIELGDIEAQIARLPQVRQAAVIVREDEPGDRRLVAYVVAAPAVNGQAPLASPDGSRQLLRRLREVLPEYMVPARFAFVSELPLTTNGKLDVKALPILESLPEDSVPAPEHERGLTHTQSVLSGVWSAVLHRESIDIHEHFFALGGDSILSIQIVAQCRAKGLQLSLKDFFECPTISSLAERVDQRDSPKPEAAVPVVSSASPLQTEAKGPIDRPNESDTLNPIQRWFFAQNFAEAHHWNQAVCLELFEGVKSEHVDGAVRDLVALHPALQQRFQVDQAGAVTVSVSPPTERIAVVSVDLRALDATSAEAEFVERTIEAQAGLDLARGPLLRAVHFRYDDGPARLLVVIHHLVVDGVSWRILREDLDELIAARLQSREARLPAPTCSTAQWNQALLRYAKHFDVIAALPAWAALSALPPNSLPAPAARAIGAGQGDRVHKLRLGSETTARLLRQVGSHFGVSVNAVLLSALMRALAARSRQASWRIDLEGHGREPIDETIDVSRTVGWFTSLFPVHLTLPGDALDAGPAESIRHVHEQLQGVHDRGLSFGVLRWMGSPQAQEQLAAVPAASILFNYLGQWDSVVSGSSLFRFAEESSGPWRSAAAHRSHPLELVVMVRQGMLELTAAHDDEVVDPVWVDELLGAWALALQELIAASTSDALTPEQSMRAVGSSEAPELPAQMMSVLPAMRALASGDRDERPFALTSLQKLFFVMDQVRPELGLQQWQFVLDGPLNSVRLQRALARVIERHEVLRCAFWEGDDHQPVQQPLSETQVPWVEEDWRELTGAEPARRLAQRLIDDQRSGFDLRSPPLMRVQLIRLSDTTWHLIWTTHHLTLDGWSWPLVMGEWSRTYAALESGWAQTETAVLPYRRFVEWRQANSLEHKDFWQRLLSGYVSPTPVASRAPTAQDSLPVECVIEMQEAQCLRLATLARRWRVTVSTLAHAAWAVCLAHANGVQDVLFGTTLAGRPPELPGVESLVGPCINNLPVPVRMDLQQGLDVFLSSLQAQQAALVEHQYTPLEAIQQASGMAWRHRLFDSLLVFQNNQSDPDVASIGAHVRSTLIAVPEATNVPLTLSITPASGWRLRFMAARGSGLGEDDLRCWIEDLMAALAALDALGLQDEAGRVALVADWLKRMPVHSARRVNHQSAAEPHASASAPAPASELEQQLVSIWRELLGSDRVPLTTNYFDMGVHSLLLVRAHRLINERMNLKLPLMALLEHANIRALAQHILGDEPQTSSALAQAAVARARKLHDAQRRQTTRVQRNSDV